MPASCPRCGVESSGESRFCANCGLELEVRSGDTRVEELPPHETGQAPVVVEHHRPRMMHAVSSFAAALRDSPLGREAARAADRAFAGADVALESLRARSRAERELIQLRRRLRLEARERLLRDLGDAVYRRDEQATERLRAEIDTLEQSVEEAKKRMQRTVEEAEARVGQARMETQPTQIETPDIPEPYPPPGELDPPEHPDIPEPYPPPGELDPPEQPDVPEPSPEGR